MSERAVHLRPAAVIQWGRTKAYCGRDLGLPPRDTSGAVLSFSDGDVTVHGALVTCEKCIEGTKHRPSRARQVSSAPHIAEGRRGGA